MNLLAVSALFLFFLHSFIEVYIINVWNLSLGPPGGRVVIALGLQLFAPYNVSGYFCLYCRISVTTSIHYRW